MKHTCKKRGTRGRSPGRKEKRKRAVKALAAAGAIAGGTQAYATPVRFDNPAHGEEGHFHWPAPLDGNKNWLDFTLDAAAQPGLAEGATSLWDVFYDDPSYGFCNVGRINAEIDVEVDFSSGFGLLVGLDSGQSVPSGSAWGSYGYATYAYYDSVAFDEGVAKYLGLRFDTGGGDQYGWIGVMRTGNELEALAWGYETEPGVAIAAGAEGEAADIPTLSEWGIAIMTLSLLAAGTWVFKKRAAQPEPPVA